MPVATSSTIQPASTNLAVRDMAATWRACAAAARPVASCALFCDASWGPRMRWASMFYDARKRDHGFKADPLKSLIVPRPIGWISTVDLEGRINLAPYSFYNCVSEFPPMVYFGTTGTYGDTPTKHSRMNAEATGEFVVNM